MGVVRPKEVQQLDILRFEAEMNHLWGELNTVNIRYGARIELEQELSKCEEKFREILSGQSSIKELEISLTICDETLAVEVLNQAENEIPHNKKSSIYYLALKNIRCQLDQKSLKPIRARHQVKEIMRHLGK